MDMEQNYIKYIGMSFKKLIDIYGFTKVELNDHAYMIEYSSMAYVIKVEKYFREFYISLYKTSESDNAINLFNLLEYLNQDDAAPKSKYFRNEKDIEECFRKQIDYLSSVIYENYILINDFFSADNFELEFAEFQKYWKIKHPELYING
jgi:hypothetical protein